MSYLEDHPGEAVASLDQAVSVLERKLAELKALRARCDNRPGLLVQDQQQAFHKYLMHLGEYHGWTTALHRCGLLGDVAFNEFTLAGRATLLPTVQEIGG